MATIQENTEFVFLSKDFVEAIRKDIADGKPVYFRSFEFSQAAQDLFNAVQECRDVLGNPKATENERDGVVGELWSVEEGNELPALIKANRNYEVDFSDVIKAIEAEMDAITFDIDIPESNRKSSEYCRQAHADLADAVQAEKNAVRSRFSFEL